MICIQKARNSDIHLGVVSTVDVILEKSIGLRQNMDGYYLIKKLAKDMIVEIQSE